jgi:hypothetical protein
MTWQTSESCNRILAIRIVKAPKIGSHHIYTSDETRLLVYPRRRAVDRQKSSKFLVATGRLRSAAREGEAVDRKADKNDDNYSTTSSPDEQVWFMTVGDSITHWIEQIRASDPAARNEAADQIWHRYSFRLLQLGCRAKIATYARHFGENRAVARHR